MYIRSYVYCIRISGWEGGNTLPPLYACNNIIYYIRISAGAGQKGATTKWSEKNRILLLEISMRFLSFFSSVRVVHVTSLNITDKSCVIAPVARRFFSH